MEQAHRSQMGAWLALMGVTAIMAAAAGGRFLVGLVFPDMQRDLQVSHAALGSVVSLSVLIVGFAQPVVGWLVDTLSARVVACAGLVSLGLGLLIGSRASSLLVLTVGLGVLAGIGLASLSPTLLTPVVAAWFERSRTTALSLAATANPAGQALVVPLLATIVAVLGWRDAFAVLGLALLLLAPVAFVLLRRRGTLQRSAGDASGCSVRDALRTSAWWQLGFGFFVCGFTMGWVMTYFVDYATRLGASHTLAATGLSLTGWASIAGAFATGWWLDRSGSSLPLSTVYALRGIGFVLLLLVGSNAVGLLVAALVIGFSWSATTPLTSSLCATLYGRLRLGTIFGILFAIMPIGTAAGSALGGALFDWSGSYTWSIAFSALAGIAAALVVLPVRVAPRPCAVGEIPSEPAYAPAR